ncbi:cbb3-type cytochrome oxidase assembly protein CcoS [Psychromonas hadalis]|uniref:cbb3-type cytochrome oxidase assembly protein CcoS n=1 Tax=Psychromonas hadalis TaxID=211669 RepID=UPI0003B5AF7F|nr:cbb3-type cytochrome oxidase assembly protein CcoS [Psychromonas hadalis]
MSIIYVLIPIAMLFVSIAVWVFFWAVKSDQYEDLDREGINILFDEDVPANKEKKQEIKKENTDDK